MSILEAVEASLADFHPKNQRQFVCYQIAHQLNDTPRLARHLNVGARHPKRVLLEAARLAQRHAAEDGRPAADWYFELLESWGGREET